MEYFLAPRALKQLQKLPFDIQVRILKKLDYYCSNDDPLSFAERLIQNEIGHYRFRIGDYRVIFDLIEKGVDVLLIGHRKDIYQ